MPAPTFDDIRHICLSLPKRGLYLQRPGSEDVTTEELAELLTTSWRLTAPKRVLKAFDEAR